MELTSQVVRAFMAGAPGLALVVDPEGRVIACNHVAERTFGCSEAELRGRDPLDSFDPSTADERRRRFQEALSTGAIVRWEDGRDGRRFANSVTPVAEGGEIVACVVLVLEVTRQRRLERERENLDERIRHAQKQEAANRLSGGFAHDVNNLLTAIAGYAAEVEEGTGAESVRAAAQSIERVVKRASELTRRLLAFVRSDPAQARPVDLDDAISSVLGMLARLIEDDVELVVEPTAGGAQVWIDPTSLDQVVVNLVTNARDAVSGGGRINVRTGIERDGDLELAFVEVSDTGVGIPADLIPFVFEPFFTTKAEDDGTGLGLATVRDIVTSNDGRVRLQSEENDGTTIRVLLPLHQARATVSRAVGSTPVPVAPARGGKILLVDDDDNVRKVVGRMLERAGYEVLPAGDHDTALEIHDAHGRVDVLFSDVLIADGWGPELVDALRHRQPDLPALFMTGYGPGDQVVGHLREPTLSKPFTRAELLSRLEEVLGRQPPSP